MDWKIRDIAAALPSGLFLFGFVIHVHLWGQEPIPAPSRTSAETRLPAASSNAFDAILQTVSQDPGPPESGVLPLRVLSPLSGATEQQNPHPGASDVAPSDASSVPNSLTSNGLSFDSSSLGNQQPEALTRPWWCDETAVPIGYRPNALVRELDQLISDALLHSPLIQSIQLEPQILETRVDQAYGTFDPSTFIDSIFRDTSDPVGNTLTTGSANRLNEIGTDNRLGIKKKNQRGGISELSQKSDFLDNNSDFFLPGDKRARSCDWATRSP